MRRKSKIYFRIKLYLSVYELETYIYETFHLPISIAHVFMLYVL